MGVQHMIAQHRCLVYMAIHDRPCGIARQRDFYIQNSIKAGARESAEMASLPGLEPGTYCLAEGRLPNTDFTLSPKREPKRGPTACDNSTANCHRRPLFPALGLPPRQPEVATLSDGLRIYRVLARAENRSPRTEERLLVERFPEYRQYGASTKRLIPYLL